MFAVAQRLGLPFDDVENMPIVLFQYWLAFFEVEHEKSGV